MGERTNSDEGAREAGFRRYRGRKARSELGWTLVYAITVLGGGAAVSLVGGLRRLDSLLGWAYLGVALVLGVLTVGVFRCRSWSRWPAVLVLAAIVVGGTVQAFGTGFRFGVALRLLLLASLSVVLALPSTGAQFRMASEARDDGAHQTKGTSRQVRSR